jgi:serine protease Do
MRQLEQEPIGSEKWEVVRRKIDAMLGLAEAQQKRVMLRAALGPEGPAPKGWIGLGPQGPMRMVWDTTGQRVTYFTHPAIVTVEPESPAARAGITPGDELIAYDGVDVIGHEFNMTRMLVPERKLSITVRRDGEAKDYAVTIARLPERVALRRAGEVPEPPTPPTIVLRRSSPDGPPPPPRAEVGRMRGPLLPGGMFIIGANGVLGAHMSSVGPELAKTLRLNPGVLINDLPETSPAFVSGLRTGDVIVGIGGKPVTTLEEVRALFMAHMAEREVPFRVVRDRKTREISVRW